jgi:DNA (cytosine-5)-methyltransferase 1
MKFGSLFSGIGGGDLGAEAAGMECAWQVEIDAACRAKLAEHWPDTERLIDVRECGKHNLKPVDVLIGGFPCQDLSVAGKRAGLAGERSGLWFEFHRILSELRPGWVVIENVAGLLSSNKGRDFAVLLRGLVDLGYGVCYRVLDAQYFGLAQRRERVFVVGHLGDGRAAEVLFEPQGLRWNPAPGRTPQQAVAAPLTRCSASGRGVNEPGRRREDDINLVAATIRGGTSGGSTHGKQSGAEEQIIVAAPLTERHVGESGRWAPINEADNLISYALNAHGGSGRIDGESETFVVSPPLRSEGADASEDGTGRQALVCGTLGAAAGKNRGLGQGNEADLLVAATLNSGGNNGGFRTEPGKPLVSSGSFGVRRLTPTECERLQGFPDGWTAGQSDSARYRQLGNAWAVPVAAWIMKRIVEADSK